MDLATLGINVKYQSAVQATDALKGLQTQSGKTEGATNKLGREAANTNTALNALSGASGLAGKSLGSLIGLAVGATAAIGTFIGTALTIKHFVDATAEADDAMAQLQSRLKSTEGVSGRTAAGLAATAKQLQQVTDYGDDAIIAMDSILLSFRNIRGDTFDRATKGALDMAAALGMDLDSAARRVGQSLNFPITGMQALSRVGVKFTTEQKSTIEQLTRTGQVAKAQAIILDSLEKSFGGAAEAARGTLGGALKALGEAFGDLFELSGPASDNLRLAVERLIKQITDPAFVTAIQTIGAALFNALTLAISLVGPVVDGISAIGTALQALAPYAIGAAAALALIYAPAILSGLASVALAIPAITTGVIRLGAALAALVGWPALIVAGLVAIVGVAVNFRDDLTNILGVDIVGVAKDAVNSIIGAFVAAYHDIGFLWKNFPDLIEAAVIGAVNAVIAGVNKMVAKVRAGVESLIGVLNKIPGVDLSLGTSGDAIKPLANPAADRLGAASASNEAQTRADMSKDYLGGAVDAVRQMTATTTEAGAALDQTAGAAFEMGEAVDQAAEKGSSKIADMFKNAQDEIAKLREEAAAYGLSGVAAEALAFKQKLLADATDKGGVISEKMKARIDALTASYLEAATALAEVKLRTDAAFERDQLFRSDTEASIADQLKSAGLDVDLDSFNAGILRTNEYLKTGLGLAQDFFGGIASDLENGVSAVDALKNAFKRLANQLIDMALNAAVKSLFGSLLGGLGLGGGGGSTGGSLLQDVFDTGFAGGGYTGDAGEGTPTGVVHGKEFVNNAASTRKNRRLFEALNDNPDMLNSRAANSNTGPAAYAPTFMIDARGAQQGVAEQIAAALDKYDKGRVGRLAQDLPQVKRRAGS